MGGLVLFGVGLFMIGDRRQLFDESFEVHAHFERLAGLQDGAKVRVAGVDAGEVAAITFPASPRSKFEITMRVLSELRPLVRTDSVATIQTDGIVGNKFVDIGAGSTSADVVVDGGSIQSREPFELADLMQKASDVVSSLGESIASLSDDAEDVIAKLGATAERADGMIEDAGRDLTEVTEAASSIAADLEVMVARVKAGEGTVGKLVNDDALYEQSIEIAAAVHRISEDAADVVANVRELSEEANALVADLESEDGPTSGLMANFSRTLESAREAMSDLEENMESAKRSFLFRGMFLERGFFDIDALTPAEYLEGAIRDQNHRTLRIWIAAEDLRERDVATLVLSELGKAKIDSAMRTILRYPGTSPLMVEGYWDSGSLDERYLAARELAFQVYEYIVRKYHRDPNLTGFITMEPLSPPDVDIDNGSERGVVLALFYDDEALPAPRHRTIH